MLKIAYLILFLIQLTTFSNGITTNDDSDEDLEGPMDKIVNNKHDKESSHDQEKSFNFQVSIKKEINVHHPEPSYQPYHESAAHYHSSISNHDDSHENHDHDSSSSYHHDSNEHHDDSSSSSHHVDSSHTHHHDSTEHHDDSSHTHHHDGNDHHSSIINHETIIKHDRPIVHNHNTHIHAVNVHLNSNPSQVESYSHVKNITQNEYSSEYQPPKPQVIENFSSDTKNITQNEFSSVSKPVKHESSERFEHSEECDHDFSSEEHHVPIVHIEHQVQVPIIQTHHHIEVQKDHHLSNLHQKLSIIKQQHHQYLKQKKDLLHSFHHQHHTKQIGLQLAVPSIAVQYGAHGAHEDHGYVHNPLTAYSHFSAGFKSAGELPPQILPAAKSSEFQQDEESEEHSMRKKRSVKDKLDDAIFEHIMTKFLHHGTPLNIHEHGSSSAVHKRQLEYPIMMPYYVHHHHHHIHQSPVRRTNHRHVATRVKYNKKQPQRKIDFHLGIPALSLILHISPMFTNHTSSYSTKPITGPAKILQNHNTEKEKTKTNPTFSQLSGPTHGLFLNSSSRLETIQYQVHEETNVSRTAEEPTESQAEHPNIINFLIPSKTLNDLKAKNSSESNNVVYETEITTHSAENETGERQIKEEVEDVGQESREGLNNEIEESIFRDSTTEQDETLIKPETRTEPEEEVAVENEEETPHPNELEVEENMEPTFEVDGDINDEEEDSANYRNLMEATTEQDDTEGQNQKEGTPNLNDDQDVESDTETSSDVIEQLENEENSKEKTISDNKELTTNSSDDDHLIRESRLVLPNQLENYEEFLGPTVMPPRRSDILIDDDVIGTQDALLPVIPVIIQDLREGRVSNADKKILSQVFGERWANIEMRANKGSVNIDDDPQRVDRALNITKAETKKIRNKRSSDYIDVLTEYFEDRQIEDDYAYEDDGEWEEGPDVSELLQVAQAHKQWKTHKDHIPK